MLLLWLIIGKICTHLLNKRIDVIMSDETFYETPAAEEMAQAYQQKANKSHDLLILLVVLFGLIKL